MELATSQTVLSGIITAIFIVLSGGVLVYFVKRTFKTIDKKISVLEDKLMNAKFITREDFTETKDSSKLANTSIIRLQEQIKALEDIKKTLSSVDALKAEFHEKFLRKTDFIRDIQIITSQLETIHKKIDHVDDKIDKSLRGKV